MWTLRILREPIRKHRSIGSFLFRLFNVSGSLPSKVRELLLFTEEDGTVVNGFRTKEIMNELRALAGNDQ